MARDNAKHHALKDGLGQVSENVTTGRGGPQGIGNVLQVDGTSGITFGTGDLVNFGGNVKEGRGHTNGVSKTYHREASAMDRRRNMVYAQGRVSVGISGN